MGGSKKSSFKSGKKGEVQTKKKLEASPAAPPPPPSVPEPAIANQPEITELEKKRLGVADELRNVERQIFDLETKYLEQSSAFGNAIRGYEGFLGGASAANKRVVIKPEERLFSSSSVTGQSHRK